MKYKVKWIEDHMSITRNMIRRYEKKGVILRNEKGINVNLKMYSFDHLRMYNIDHINTCCSRW